MPSKLPTYSTTYLPAHEIDATMASSLAFKSVVPLLFHTSQDMCGIWRTILHSSGSGGPSA